MIDLGIVKSEEVELLINDIMRIYGYDFSNYNRASLTRRINRLCSIDSFSSFAVLRYRINNDKNYLQRFIEEIMVNVTEMFRDPLFYKTLRTEILPKLASYPFIRIWVAGCSTGEEPISLAILLKEANLYDKSLIYATDINSSVLEKASSGIVATRNMRQYAENYIASSGVEGFSKYYRVFYEKVQFDRSLLERIIFSTHNLISDASFNEFQLILCRNVLIYFNKSLQDRVFTLFDQSLQTSGYLCLGSKENIRFSVIEKRFKQVGRDKIWQKL